MSVQRERILKGQCPLCGKEAAPYRLCYDHRQTIRIVRMLKRGARHEYFHSEKRSDGKLYWTIGAKVNDPAVREQMGKWAIPFHLPETDRRGRPRLRGISVDVEETLIAVMRQIGRPCSVEEISEAWGRLRDRRTSPLAADLATIIAAKDKRARKAAKRAATALQAPAQ